LAKIQNSLELELQIDKLFKNISKSIREIGIEETNRCIEQNISKKEVQDLDVYSILKIVSKNFGVSSEDIVNSSERGYIQEARSVVCYVLCVQGKMSYRDVARGVFNRPNHLFVFNSLKKHKEKLNNDTNYKKKFNKVLLDLSTKL